MKMEEFSETYLAGVKFGVTYTLEMSGSEIKLEDILDRVVELAESEVIADLKRQYPND